MDDITKLTGIKELDKTKSERVAGGKKMSKAQCAYLWALCLSGAAQYGSVGVEQTCRLAVDFC